MRPTEPPKVLFRLEYIRRPGPPAATRPIRCVKWFYTMKGATEYQEFMKAKRDAEVISLSSYKHVVCFYPAAD